MSRNISFTVQYCNNKKSTIRGLHNTKNSNLANSKFTENEVKELKKELINFKENNNKKYKYIFYSLNVSNEKYQDFNITGKRKTIDIIIHEFDDYIKTVNQDIIL